MGQKEHFDVHNMGPFLCMHACCASGHETSNRAHKISAHAHLCYAHPDVCLDLKNIFLFMHGVIFPKYLVTSAKKPISYFKRVSMDDVEGSGQDPWCTGSSLISWIIFID